MGPEEVTLTLAELCEQAHVTPRTVRYYIAQGLLPSPGLGTGARYSGLHLDQIKTIRKLQRAHLPLAEIRRRIDAGGYAGAQESLPINGMARLESAEPPTAFNVREGGVIPSPINSNQAIADRRHRHAARRRSEWQRIELALDVELHVRRPLTREQNRLVERLLAAASTIFAEEE